MCLVTLLRWTLAGSSLLCGGLKTVQAWRKRLRFGVRWKGRLDTLENLYWKLMLSLCIRLQPGKPARGVPRPAPRRRGGSEEDTLAPLHLVEIHLQILWSCVKQMEDGLK